MLLLLVLATSVLSVTLTFREMVSGNVMKTKEYDEDTTWKMIATELEREKEDLWTSAASFFIDGDEMNMDQTLTLTKIQNPQIRTPTANAAELPEVVEVFVLWAKKFKVDFTRGNSYGLAMMRPKQKLYEVWDEETRKKLNLEEHDFLNSTFQEHYATHGEEKFEKDGFQFWMKRY